ncbi:MAG: hypothetical protein ACRC92_21705 [Peptostreptococcaceae bacterium]
MGARFDSYVIMRFDEAKDMTEINLSNNADGYEIIKTGYRAKIIPLVNPSQSKDRQGGLQMIDKRKMYGVKSFSLMRQGDYVYLESSYDPVTQRYNKGYRIINEPRVGVHYCVFQVEGI